MEAEHELNYVAVDKLMGCMMLLILFFGGTANILAFRYFIRRKTTASTSVYRVIALTDIISCLNTYPVILTMLSNRQPLLFKWTVFNQFWGLTWEPIPYLSISLVLIISLFRTFSLLFPLKHASTRLANGIMMAYSTFLLFRYIISVSAFGIYRYTYESAYCWRHITSVTFEWFDLYLSMISMALPIVPIVISALATSLCLYRNRRRGQTVADGVLEKKKNRKRDATVTILMFTMTYFFCNIPVFITCVWFSVSKFTNFRVNILDPRGGSIYLRYYIWPVTYVLLVQLNACLNPILYFYRMKDFRVRMIHFKLRDSHRRCTVS